MYQLVSAKARIVNHNGTYESIEAANVSIRDLVDGYDVVYVQLTHSTVAGNFTLNLNHLSVVVKESSLTLPQYFSSIGDASLPTLPKPIDFDEKYVEFYDGWSLGFTAKPMNRNYHPDMDIEQSLQTDLLISHESAKYDAITKNCLFTVNGFIHIGDSLDTGVVIYEGATSAAIADSNLFGLVNFEHIGELEIIPITESMLISTHALSKMSDRVYINMPKPILGKVPMLVIGGYLHALDGLYRMVSDTTICFDFYRYPWLRRYYLAEQFIDLTTLASVNMDNGSQSVDKLYSDEIIKAWFTLPQSFIVLIDTADIYTSTMEVTYGNLPGIYTSPVKPIYPLLLGDGRMAEYKRSDQNGVHVLRTADYLQNNPIRETMPFKDFEYVSNQSLTTNPLSPAVARHLIISKTVEVDYVGTT